MIWVFIDLSYLAYRALHAVGNLEYEDIPTGVVFGFFHQLRTICTDPRIQSNKVAIFCDSRSSLRKQEYPEYKEKRRVERDEEYRDRVHSMRTQIHLLTHTTLKDMGLPVYYSEGLESDDLMAQAAKQVSEGRSGKKEAVMVTADGDLYQCISPSVHWYDPGRNSYHTESTFLATKGIPARKWGEVKALAGCQSDNVGGIPGVGEKTAVKYLLGQLPPKHKSYQAIESVVGRRTRKQNRRLVLLPHEHTPQVQLVPPDYDMDAFFSMCEECGLVSILAEEKSWRNLFGKSMFQQRKRGMGL